jgi:hypothetical protein
MKGVVWSLALALLFMTTACTSGPERARAQAFYSKYEAHCKEHSRDFTGEVDEQSRYEECMNYFLAKDESCPTCVIDPHMTSPGN